MKKIKIAAMLTALVLMTGTASCSFKIVIPKTDDTTTSAVTTASPVTTVTTTTSVTTTTTSATTTVKTTAATASTTKAPTLGKFKNIKLSYKDSNKVYLSWNEVEEAESYKVSINYDKFSNYGTNGFSKKSEDTDILIPNYVLENDLLYVRVIAINGKEYEKADFYCDTTGSKAELLTISEYENRAKTSAVTTTSKPQTTTTKATTTKPKITTAKTTTTKPKVTTTKTPSTVDNSKYYNPDTGYSYIGSAGALDGKTAVVSVFVNNGKYSWDFSNSNDKKKADTTRGYIKIATEWITEQSRQWGRDAQFIYDWSKYSELIYQATLDSDYYNFDDYANWYSESWEWVDKNIKSLDIKKKYDADNIVYLFFFDSPLDNTQKNSARGYYKNIPYPYEVAWFHYGRNDYVTQPSAIAHEILHLFGAPDLYIPNNNLITQEFADYMNEKKPNDIMHTIYEDGWKYRYDTITNEITEITAYYLGWTDSSSYVKEWKLGTSEHAPYIS